jgi:hypothetical protein
MHPSFYRNDMGNIRCVKTSPEPGDHLVKTDRHLHRSLTHAEVLAVQTWETATGERFTVHRVEAWPGL